MRLITREYFGNDTAGSCDPLPSDGPVCETSEREIDVSLTADERHALIEWDRGHRLPAIVETAAARVATAIWGGTENVSLLAVACRLRNACQPPELRGGFWGYGFDL